MSAQPLDPLRFPLWGSRLIEASAGTGKTYTIASLYVRLVLGHGDTPGGRPLLPPEILVVTFTRAATQELKDRIRKRLGDAAACFLQWTDGDAFLRELRSEYPPERWAACARQLQLAADWMDEAAVSTIDAWCYRMLREHAFDSASLFEIDMETDAAERIAEATRDYWRLHIAPLPRDDFERVLDAIKRRRSDTRVPADCDALARMLAKVWLRHVPLLGPQPDPAQAIANCRRRLEACKAPWRVWAEELRKLLDRASADGCIDRRKLNDPRRREWLDQLEKWAHDPDLPSPFKSDSKAWDRFTPGGIADVWKKGEPPRHPALDAFADLHRQIGLCDKEVERVIAHAAVWVAGRVAELRRGRALLDYGDLLEKLDTALAGPNGDSLARTIRAQFPAALIDEFQDTSPVQYHLFDRIYKVDQNEPETLLALIGDPKQAIYRFRGADIHAYLEARQACSGRLYTLGSNFRSSAGMVAAVNHLFSLAETEQERGAFLFRRADPRGKPVNPVPFLPVVAAADPGEWRVGETVPAPLTVWYATEDDVLRRGGAAVAAACASTVLRLLQQGAEGKAGFRRNGAFAPLRAADMAILVNDGYEARDIRVELSRRGIRSVYLSDDGSVYQSDAASDILAWLRACAEPGHADYVRAALATATLGLPWRRLETLVDDETEWQAMLERFAAYREHWRRYGVLPMLRRFMHDFGVPARLFAAEAEGAPTGERHLTDLLHLAELLQEASGSLDGEHAVIRYLEEQIGAGSSAATDADAARIRLESDAGLVQVVTVHKSKGLEYPLVFYPYAYRARPVKEVSVPAPYRDADNTLRVLAHECDADPDLLDDIHRQLEDERLAEDLRKLYVALTRAKYATWIAVLPGDYCRASALAYLLGGRDACEPDTLGETLSGLRLACDSIAAEPLPEPLDSRYRPPADEVAAAFHWRTMRRRIETRWTMSSYSALARLAMEHAGDDGGLYSGLDALALPDEPRLEAYLEAYAADPGPEAAVGNPRSAAHIHGFPRGAAPGSLLHGLLEWVFRQGPAAALADAAALRALVEKRCRIRGWEAHAPAVADWLQQFLTRRFRLPGGDGHKELVLADLARVVPELEFWFGVNDAALARLDALVHRHLLPGLPRPMIPAGQLNGMLRGFVDLVFEHDGRYYVADYKSNWLGPDDGAYDAAALTDAVLKHRYDLQAAIYLYALHRHLVSRLGDAYDFNAHFGGALVFFMRGHAAPTQGLVGLRPGHEFLQELESVFGAAPGDLT